MYLFFKIRNMWCFLALQNNLCLFALFLLFYYQQNTRYFDLFCFFLLAHFEQFCPTCVKLTLKTQIKFKFQPAIKFASVVADHLVPKAYLKTFDQRKPMQKHFSSHCSQTVLLKLNLVWNFADKTEWSEFFSEDKVLFRKKSEQGKKNTVQVLKESTRLRDIWVR